MIQPFSDAEYAVICDSLRDTRDRIRGEGHATPNIDAALAKFNMWADPRGCQFVAVAGEDRHLLLDRWLDRQP